MALWPVQLPLGLSNHCRHVEETGKAPRLPGPPRPPRSQVLTREELRSGTSRRTNTPSTTTRLVPRQQAPSPEPVGPSKSIRRAHDSKKSKKSRRDKKHRRRTSRENEDNPLVTIQLAFRQRPPSREFNTSKKPSKSSKSEESFDFKKSKQHKKHRSKPSHDHISLPPKTSLPAPRQSPSLRNLTKSKKPRSDASHNNAMGLASPASRRSKTAPLTAKEKRNKTPKPQSRCVSTTPIPAVATKKKREKKGKKRDKIKQPKPLGPGTRPGAHKHLPITIDSDEESDPMESMETAASAAIRYDALCLKPAQVQS
jgi:hypothetical protein